MQELSDLNVASSSPPNSPYPGLVCVPDDDDDDNTALLDPVYALQVLPRAVRVEGSSIGTLAKGVVEAVVSSSTPQQDGLRAAPRGSLVVHAVVPGMLKGTLKPPGERRVRTVAESVVRQLQKQYPCARRQPTNYKDKDDGATAARPQRPLWLLQLLLLSPEELAVSLSPVESDAAKYVGGTWPCATMPAGLAMAEMPDDKHDHDGNTKHNNRGGSGSRNNNKNTAKQHNNKSRSGNRNQATTHRYIPSSAYRKLLEAVSCMNTYPPATAAAAATTNDAAAPIVVDLGASPGGWTAALRKMGCGNVVAVDRSDLAPHLMRDERHITFVRGDAFAFAPPASSSSCCWMVSDLIAFPERVAELLKDWCGNRRAERLIVTVKFKGDRPHWEALRTAVDVARGHGYDCRAKHFFNNKNEVTLMVALRSEEEKETVSSLRRADEAWKITPMFPLAWSGAVK